MSLIDQIRMAQRDAGEAAVMADLKRKGLLIEEPEAHPPEADKLLQQALEALEYRLQQTRPIHQADVVMESIRTYLENKA